jgi:hypothetical protein
MMFFRDAIIVVALAVAFPSIFNLAQGEEITVQLLPADVSALSVSINP